MEACIIGAGNRWRGDDGIGLLIVDSMMASSLKDWADFFKLEEGLFELQSFFERYRKMVIIDAMPPGLKPGKLRQWMVDGKNIQSGQAYSLHDLDLLWQIRYGFSNGFNGELLLIGIEGLSLDYREGLSYQLIELLPEIRSDVAQAIVAFLT